jgi:hypothetical protein
LLETNPTPAEQVKGKLLNEHAPGKIRWTSNREQP